MVEPLTGDDPREAGGYRLRGRLGSGAMGQVYLALTPGGRQVAVKMIRAEFGNDERFRARFRQEMAAAQRVHGLFTARIKRIEARLAVTAGTRAGRVAGYLTTAERHAKTIRIQALRTRLADVDQQLGAGRVSVCRGGKALLRTRNNLAAAGLTETRWRERWAASRAVHHRRRGEGQDLGQRDDPLEPGPELAGDGRDRGHPL